MTTIIINPSHQLANKCVLGDTEAQHCAIIAKRFYQVIKIDGVFNPILIGPAPADKNTEALRRKWAIAQSNSYDADLHIGIHTNAGGGQGVEAIYYSAMGAKAAKALITPLVGLFGNRIPLTYENKSLEELNSTKAVAVILEIGFHDFKNDAEIIHNKVNDIAQFLKDGLYSYYNIVDYKTMYHTLLAKHIKLKSDLQALITKYK